MDKDEYIKFLEDRLKHSDEQLEKAMEMLAKLMSKMGNAPPYKVTC
jgi:prefoldin subunit 5